MDKEYEVKLIDIESEKFELYQSKPIYYKINEGDCVEISENQLIDCTMLPHVKFIKKKFYYKTKFLDFYIFQNGDYLDCGCKFMNG